MEGFILNGLVTVRFFCNNQECGVASIDYDAKHVVVNCEFCHSPESAMTREILRCNECDGFLSKKEVANV